MDDPNQDLIGYEYVTTDGAVWRVTGTDAVLGAPYVNVRRVVEGATSEHPSAMRVQRTSDVRRRKEIEASR